MIRNVTPCPVAMAGGLYFAHREDSSIRGGGERSGRHTSLTGFYAGVQR